MSSDTSKVPRATLGLWIDTGSRYIYRYFDMVFFSDTSRVPTATVGLWIYTGSSYIGIYSLI